MTVLNLQGQNIKQALSYLERNLLPLVRDIKTPKTDSYIMIAAGLGDKTSQSSILIQMGYKLEDFWNKVISDCAVNLIENNNKIDVGGKRPRQIDHLFYTPIHIDLINYLESKCNLNFDTEKKPASNEKIGKVCEAVKDKYSKDVKAAYFVPCIRTIPSDVLKKYPNVDVYGVEWLMNTLNCDLFTVDEFFTFFEEVIGPILEEKIYG